jgi:hypothetical protein
MVLEEEDGDTCCFGRCQKVNSKKKPAKGFCGRVCTAGCDVVFNNKLTRALCGTCACYEPKTHTDKAICTFFVMANVALLIAVLIPLVLESAIYEGIHDQVVVDGTNAHAFDTWQTNMYGEGDDLEVYYKTYFFDVQNPLEALQGAKPVVVEKGPYCYREYFQKFDISWSDHGDTVTYNNQRVYYFNEDCTAPGLSMHDNLTLPYASTLGFNFLLDKIPAEANELIDALFEGLLDPIEAQLLALADTKHGPTKNAILAIEAGIERLEAVSPLKLTRNVNLSPFDGCRISKPS